jgi:hypothetical protein
VLENTWDIAALVGMSPVMLGSLAANPFPLQMYGTKLKVFWTGTPDKVDDRVMTRRTNRDCPTQRMGTTFIFKKTTSILKYHFHPSSLKFCQIILKYHFHLSMSHFHP